MDFFEKKISNLVENQFPALYAEEGPVFVEFVKKYYEWMESSNNAIYHSRRLMEYGDIDSTVDDFLLYFKSKYLNSMQFNTATNTRQLIKHSLDLYRSKGSERAIDLFFKTVFGKPATVYFPGDDIFKPSNGEWKIPRYIEVSYANNLKDFVNLQVEGINSKATAFVEKYIRKKIKGRYIELFYISDIRGNFETGERIQASTLKTVGPTVIGSLSSLNVVDGSFGYSIGDIVNISSNNGVQGKARVSSIANTTGTVSFSLTEGGWGYDSNSEIIISDTVLRLNEVRVGSNNFPNLMFNQFETLIQPKANVQFSGINGEDLAVGDFIYRYEADTERVLSEARIISITTNSVSNTGEAFVSIISDDFDPAFSFEAEDSLVLFDDFEFFSGWISRGSGEISQSSNQAHTGTFSLYKTGYGDPNGAFKRLNDTVNRDWILETWIYRDTLSGENDDRISIVDINGNGYGFNINSTQINIERRDGWVGSSSLEYLDGSTSWTRPDSDSTGSDWYRVVLESESNGTLRLYVYDSIGSLQGNLVAHDIIHEGLFDRVAILGGYDYYVDELKVTTSYNLITENSRNIVSENQTWSSTSLYHDEANSDFDFTFNTESNNIVGLEQNYFYKIHKFYTESEDLFISFEDNSSILNETDATECFITSFEDKSASANVMMSSSNNTLYVSNSIIQFAQGEVVYQSNGTSDTANGVISSVQYNGSNATIVVTNTYGTFSLEETLLSKTSSATGKINSVSLDLGIFNIDGTLISTNNNIVFGYSSNTYAAIERIGAGSGANVVLGDTFLYQDTIRINTDYISDYAGVLLSASDYGFLDYLTTDIDSVIATALLNFEDITKGTINSIVVSGIGINYDTIPYILIYDKTTYDLLKKDFIIKIENTEGFFIADEIVYQGKFIKGIVKEQSNSTFLYLKRTTFDDDFDEGYDLMLEDGENLLDETSIDLMTDHPARLFGITSGSSTDIISVKEDENSARAGINAAIAANVVTANGSVRTLDIVDSGFGYYNDEIVTFSSDKNINSGVAKTSVFTQGFSEGFYKRNDSTLSGNKYLQDSNYYQEFSYEIRSPVTLDKYSDMLKNILHIAGTKYFSRFSSETVLSTGKINVNTSITVK